MISDLEEELLDEISAFAKLVFRSSLGESSVKDATPQEDSLQMHFGELAVDNTSVSIQLLLWAVTDENGTTLTSPPHHLYLLFYDC